ncbi:insulinase family protein [Kribbella italica]|uniref:Putative Zn-dependent peptidase n=1 Tax=Kribbella italica TaxID=1540520 RepID=A0A7W9JF23_9ACTN|nr:insulinase family protein [Kribbella italica]MBB5840979.1 putative Zn-dependent peptidase [Kribbella italica]
MPQYLDGVRLLHHQEPQSTTDATLTFAVGARDETLPTVGVAHALEHLVMNTIRRLPIRIDATVSTTTTTFEASGTPERVGEFLTGICAALSAPPVERLEVEAGVLAAEDGWVTHPMAALLYYVRYGARGAGLDWLDGPGPDGITAEQVNAFAQKWFTADNAVLQVTGPVPADLKLPLPARAESASAEAARPQAGTRPRHGHYPARQFPGPSVVGYGIPGAAVLLSLPDGDPARIASLATDVLQQRIEESARHGGGHSYVVDCDSVHQPDGTTDWVLYAEAREGTEEAVALAVVEALTDLAANGPSEDELRLALDRFEEQTATSDADLAAEFAVLRRELFDEPVGEPLDPERVRAVRPEDLAAVLRAALPTAIGYAEEDAVEQWTKHGFTEVSLCPVGGELPAGEEFRPPRVARLFVREAREQKLVLTPDELAVRDEDGVHHVPWDEVVGVMRAGDGTSVVFGANGCVLPVSGDLYRGGKKAVAELERRVDRSLWFKESRFKAEED